MRIALISDLHGNESALNTVLKDIEKTGIDRLVCLGDVATLGSNPVSVIRTLRDIGCPCVMGNHDAFLIDPDLIHTYTDSRIVCDAVDWCRDQLADADLDFLRTFPSHMDMSLNERSSLFLCHGSPRSHMEDILSTTPAEDLDRMLDGITQPIFICGHTHMPMLRQHRDIRMLNPGSVGMAFREFTGGQAPTLTGYADYAVVESDQDVIHMDLCRVPLDIHGVCQGLNECANPLKKWLLGQYAPMR